jgi:ATP-dependent Zn protease
VSVRLAYHEAGHALVARSLGRRVESVSLSLKGGLVRQEPLESGATDEEIERALVVVFAGCEAEQYAPFGPDPKRNGDDPYFTDGELAAMALGDESGDVPSDEDVVAHYTERIGEEATERARSLAAELVERKHAIGQLKLLADELLWRNHMTGEDVERLLETKTWRRGAFTPLP